MGIHGDLELRGLTAGKGAGACHPVARATRGCAASGYKNPELLGWSGLRTKPCEAPWWVTQRGPPRRGRAQELKSTAAGFALLPWPEAEGGGCPAGLVLGVAPRGPTIGGP